MRKSSRRECNAQQAVHPLFLRQCLHDKLHHYQGIEIPAGINQLDNEIFMGCTNLSKVTLPETGLAASSH